MSIDQAFALILTSYALLAAITAGGFALVFMQLQREFSRIDSKFDNIDDKFVKIDEKLDKLRVDLAEEFRAQRAEVSAQTTALANAIIAVVR